METISRYAEINFEDGAANYIQALALVARLVHSGNRH
jgi:hypothetical protein